MELTGSGALVTGGASGLGEATVRRLAKAGAYVTIAHRDEGRARTTRTDSPTVHLGGKCLTVQV
jgi:NAD(P)-dependent dehydrogenase (short-subunit alcohol dehydrogenase family)